MSTETNMKEKIERLTEFINHHNFLYHTLGKPEISDEEFDKAYALLVKLESRYPAHRCLNSPTKKIGNSPYSNKVCLHRQKMLGLDNVFTRDEFIKWVNRLTRKNDISNHDILYADLKADGLAIELVYHNGKLVQASLRGDGVTGDDVTEHVMLVPNIPKTIPIIDDFEVYGELVLSRSSFLKINDEQRANNLLEYSTQRNAVSGLLRNKSKIYMDKVMCYIYGSTLTGYKHLSDMLFDLQDTCGFYILEHAIGKINKLTPIMHLYDSFNKRADLTLPADGIVVKMDNLEKQESLGATERSPRYAIAWKFEVTDKVTKLLDIIHQVGRTGIITPVAILDPVNIDGVNVSRVSLKNDAYIKGKNLAKGVMVSIHRAGGVIPEIKEVVSPTSDITPYKTIKECPICGTPIVRISKANIICPNLECKGIKKARLAYFVSKSGLDIKGFGPKLVDKVIEDNQVIELGDIFSLDTTYLRETLGSVAAENLIYELTVAMSELTLSKLFRAINIPGLDNKNLDRLLDNINSIDEIKNAIKDVHILKSFGMTPVAIQSLLAYFTDRQRELSSIECFHFNIPK